MKIELQKIKIRDLVDGYSDNPETWEVLAYWWKLDVRPPYQREFIYGEKERQAVIDTVTQWFPLNIMYRAVRGDWTYEIIDWQQRTISICQYINNDFFYMMRKFYNLTEDEKDKILDYELMVYFCEWTDKEKLKRFETINIAWKELEKQELLNAIYCGSWVTDAKRYFSRKWWPAEWLAGDYMAWEVIRQKYLETAIKWISKWNIEVYMANHQHDQNANELWLYFKAVIERVNVTFPHYRKEMKWVSWWELYNEYKDTKFDTAKLEEQIKELMMDEDVTKKSWIYPYVITWDESCLHIRAFTDNMKREAYERQQWICIKCEEHFQLKEMEADHITPRSQWWATTAENCQMLCKDCNRRKSNK